MGQDEDAIKNFVTSLRLVPDDVHANYNLGRAYIRTKKYREAILSLEKAREMDPDNAEIHLNLGYAYYLQKRYRDATGETQIAVRLAPADDQGQLLLATLYRQTYEKSLALLQYEAVKGSNSKLAAKIYQIMYGDKIFVISDK